MIEDILEKFLNKIAESDTGKVKKVSLNHEGLQYNYENGQSLIITGDGWYFKSIK